VRGQRHQALVIEIRPLDRLMTLTERWKIAMTAIHLRHERNVGTTYKRALP